MKHRQQAGMMDAWRVLASAVDDVRSIGVHLVGLNILWFFTSCLIITAPPATAALYAMTREMGYRHPIEWQDFFRFLRRYFWVSWRWGLVNLLAVLITSANLFFYQNFDPPTAFILRGIWISLFILWIIIQMYCFPVLLEQQEPSVRLALLNASVLVLRHPRFTLIFALVTFTFSIASIAVIYFWFFFTVALLCYFCNRGVWYLTRIEKGEEVEV
jgi:uncharacterized membrane protein YesL